MKEDKVIVEFQIRDNITRIIKKPAYPSKYEYFVQFYNVQDNHQLLLLPEGKKFKTLNPALKLFNKQVMALTNGTNIKHR
jgi:hypothetical protein